ncbi:MAG: DUF1292 domain-containing protein [Firmicutes bacterium]|nr:DUF1292 domain-containing protein [Bacillota bacterium]
MTKRKLTEERVEELKNVLERHSAPHIFLINETTGKLDRFEVLDKVECEGRRFIVLYPTPYPRVLGKTVPENVDEDGEDVVILELGGVDTDHINCEALDDDMLQKVFEKFKERNKNIYEFV